MVPLGYMAKTVVARPEWLACPGVDQILSVSSCVSPDFADYVAFWRHNGFWFFDQPDAIVELATAHAIDLSGSRWFYYEAFARDYDTDLGKWVPYAPEPSFPTHVVRPAEADVRGFDILCVGTDQVVGCSPLSCNSLAESVAVNADCLLPTVERAHEVVAGGALSDCEPGPYRIVSVQELQPPDARRGPTSCPG